jgi:hypothetical protein
MGNVSENEATVTSDTMSNADRNARLELLRAIRKSAAAVGDSDYEVRYAAGVLEQLSLAYRYASGGTQPGSVVVSK